MGFPVVVMDKTDAGKNRLVRHWMIYVQGRQKHEASWAESRSAFLACVSQQSALVTIQNLIVSHSIWHTAISVVSFCPLQWLLKLPLGLLTTHPPPATFSSLHKGPFTGPLAILPSLCLTAPVIHSTSISLFCFSGLEFILFIFFSFWISSLSPLHSAVNALTSNTGLRTNQRDLGGLGARERAWSKQTICKKQ